MTEHNLVKIQFCFYSEIVEEDTSEDILAEVVDFEKGYYKINNIPFNAPNIALGDIVWAQHSYTEDMLTYRKTIRLSGNSTIHAVILDDKYDIDSVRGMFEEDGCASEKLNDRYFALNIPANTDYLLIKQKLDELEDEEVIGYAESCLSQKHQYKNYFFQ
jgi:hypothetical protein